MPARPASNANASRIAAGRERGPAAALGFPRHDPDLARERLVDRAAVRDLDQALPLLRREVAVERDVALDQRGLALRRIPRIEGLIIAAKYGRRVLVLRDLDAEPCAGPVVRRLAPSPPSTFCLRLAVRAVEAWLLADHDGMARGLKVSKAGLPPLPETLTDPKGELRRIGQGSRDSEVRRQCTASPQGFGALTSSLAAEFWDPQRAATRAPSLARALARLRALCR